MRERSRLTLPVPEVSSLRWDGDTLIDDLRGGVRYGLDGSRSAPLYPDRSTTLEQVSVRPDGRWVALYTEDLGLLELYRDGTFYGTVEPAPHTRGRRWVTFLRLNGREVLAFVNGGWHVALYDLERRALLHSGVRDMAGKHIHRLEALGHGPTLLCSHYSGYGDMLHLASLESLFLPDQTQLEDPEGVYMGRADCEVPLACKLDEGHVLFYSSGGDVGESLHDLSPDERMLWSRGLGVYSLERREIVYYRSTNHDFFDLVPISPRYFVSYGATLRLHDLESEAFLEWPEFDNEVSPWRYPSSWESVGTLAVDPLGQRIALWHAGQIHVIALELDPEHKPRVTFTR